MSKQTRVGLVFSLIVLFALPGDAMAGGFRIFKRCRVKTTNCCPRPTCTPCAPVACDPCAPAPCQPTAPAACAPCEESVEQTVPSALTYLGWYAVGSGMNGTTPCSVTGPCATTPSAAIAALPGGCNIYSYNLFQKQCEEVVENTTETSAANAVGPAIWQGYVTVQNKNGKIKTKKVGSKKETVEEALQAAQDLIDRAGDEDVEFEFEIRIED